MISKDKSYMAELGTFEVIRYYALLKITLGKLEFSSVLTLMMAMIKVISLSNFLGKAYNLVR